MRLREPRPSDSAMAPDVPAGRRKPGVKNFGPADALVSEDAAAATVGPRIYNLFPRLIGPVDKWVTHLPRIAAMNFNWVYVNSFHEPGASGSLYAVKDPYRLNSLFRGSAVDDDKALQDFTTAAGEHWLD